MIKYFWPKVLFENKDWRKFAVRLKKWVKIFSNSSVG